MKFSFLKEKITPEIPVTLAGFSARDHKAEGVHDDPYASVVLIQADEPVIIIALDLCSGDLTFADGMKEAIREKYGLTRDRIIINYSHTHSAVSLTGCAAENGPGRENDADRGKKIRYCSMVKEKIMEMIERGFGSLTEGDMYICKGESMFGVSRRYPSEDGILWKPYFNEDCMDKDLFLLKFVGREGKLCGLIYNYACHPTTMGPSNYLVSADFPGVVRRVLEEENPGISVVFLQGCGADIKPYISAENGVFKGCTFDELEQAGRRLANEISQCIRKLKWRRVNAGFRTGFSEIRLYTEVWDEEKWQTVLNDPNEPEYRKKAIRKKLEAMKVNKPQNYLPYYISYLKLDDQACMICLECEVVSDIGKEIKRLFAEDVIVLGYSNNITCYIPTKKVLQQGGYERDSFMGTSLAGPFVPEIEDIIVGRLALMAIS